MEEPYGALPTGSRDLQSLVQLLDLCNIIILDWEGRITHWSAGCQRVYGYRPDAALGRLSRELLKTRFPESREAIERALLQSGRWEGELVHTTAEGREIAIASEWMLHRDAAGNPAAIVEASTDLTSHRRAEEKLHWVVESSPNAFVMADSDGHIVLVNAKTEKMFGYQRGELIGRSVDMLVPRQYRSGHDAERRRYMTDPQSRPMGAGRDLWGVRKDGTQVPVEIGLSPIHTDAGTFVLASIVDISERKQAEQALQAALISAEKAKAAAELAKAAAELANDAKDQFLAVLSHELRTPLTPVVLGVSLLQQRSDLSAETQETLEMVRRNAEMEAKLIDDLLDVTRITRGKIELCRTTVELRTILQRAVEVCQPDIATRRVHFGVDWGNGHPYWINADVPRLQQVFWNLLKNAIKFTPPEGCVGIRCRANGTQVVVEVTDSGMGIPPESLTRVFDAFEQTNRSITQQFGGLGLGLAISKALVELHGGRIEALSEGTGKGATFRIQLPLVASMDQPASPAPAESAPRPVATMRILMVEDHVITAKMMRSVLMAEGHAVETAGDLATALDLADQHSFDLLLSDLGLPDGTGHDLMRMLRARGCKFPGIALSGYGQEQDIQRSREAGFAAHVTKPASREALLEVIRQVSGPLTP